MQKSTLNPLESGQKPWLSRASLRSLIRKFVSRRSCWTIGIYTGPSPFDLAPAPTIRNPVLTAQDVADVPAAFVADPFMVRHQGTWHMFFEVLNAQDGLGDIGLATSNDGLQWSYQQIVLEEPFHLSYPYVFEWNHEYYMVPESHQARSVRLYQATQFPTAWSCVQVLLQNDDYVDPTLFVWDDRWWMFTSSPQNHTLRLHFADDLRGPWTEHPKSPVVRENAAIARPGGRVLVMENKVFRYCQDDQDRYGRQVRSFEITQLTTTDYTEVETQPDPILQASGTGWNATGMHTIDPHPTGPNQWIACVDGCCTEWIVGTKS